MTPSWKLSRALRAAGGLIDEFLAIATRDWKVLRRAQLAEQDREHEALTEWHAKQGGKMKEAVLEVVPTVRGQVSALRNIPDEHDT